MTASTTRQDLKIARRIEVLKDIIERASTPEGEREAAKHMLHTLRMKLQDLEIDPFADSSSSAASDFYYRLPERVYGAKYEETQGLYGAALTKRIQADLRALYKLGAKVAKRAGTDVVLAGTDLSDAIADAPRGLQFFVSMRRGSSSLYVKIKGVPADWWTIGTNGYGDEIAQPTEQLQQLADAVYAFIGAYNYDGSDAMVDYFDTRFYGHVEADGSGKGWQGYTDLHRSRASYTTRSHLV